MKQTFSKIIIFALVLLLVALGVLGILFPILPGILFLGIAAVIAARHFPALAFCLNQNRYSAECMRISNGFFNLGVWDRIKLCFWSTAKFTVNGMQWTLQFLEKQYRKLMQN